MGAGRNIGENRWRPRLRLIALRQMQRGRVPADCIPPDVLRGPENVPDCLDDDKIYTFFGLSQLVHTTKCHNLNEPMAE
ncbi:hypothetical protein F441_05218 [Phytophthora nicotianae CJ01A1]|uniref:Uncharacterized protein n=1 Tax=Phytophthora nicotianae CJ01A1 TaxID=1317063 RepID=W2XEZ2_PHYNI|nr:hypothetical protein F441_05218 [Phytophthora nicotianae CJ01A1]